MKKTMKTGFIRDIKSSKGRFISILLLMLISSFTLVGLKLVGPDIRATGDEYFKEYRLADLSIMSNYGLADAEQELITDSVVDGKVEFGYLQDVTIADTPEALRVFSNSKEISQYELVSGKMPAHNKQIAISEQFSEKYPLGSKIKLTEKGDEDDFLLKEHDFEVVGYVNSLEVLSTIDRGATNVGTGELAGYAVVNEAVFDSEFYMIARISYDDLRTKNSFLHDYLQTVNQRKNELEADLSDLPQVRIDEITSEINSKLKENKQELRDAETELNDAKKKLDDGKKELTEAKKELDDANQQILDGEVQLADGKRKIAAGFSEIENSKKEIATGQKEVDANRQKLEAGQNELDSARIEIESNQARISQGKSLLNQSKVLSELAIKSLKNSIKKIDTQLADPNLTPEKIAQLEAQKAELQSRLATAEAAYSYFISSVYTPGIAELDLAQGEIDKGLATINEKQAELDQGFAELNAAQAEIDSGQAQLEQANAELIRQDANLKQKESELQQAKRDLEAGYREYETGLKTLNENLDEFNSKEKSARKEIEDGYKKIRESEQDLEDLSLPVYTVYTRSETPTSSGYQVFTSLATSVDKVANVFPILLYAVAALVTYTTMTRYVEDERINTGTLLSLGYSEKEIKRKYIVYGAVSSFLGAVLGTALGAYIVPMILYTSFRSEFTTPDLVFTFDTRVALGSLIISILCAVIPAFVVTASEFKSSPASLLLPKPPGNGSKILLERLKPVWNRLSFAHKVTARNIFRYKKRMFMTIFGVSGSVALLFTGLALQGSIANVVELQFKDIIHYDAIAIKNDNSSLNEGKELDELLSSSNIQSTANFYIENISIEAGENDERQAISFMVADDFEGYVDFKDRKTDEEYELKNGEVLINERLASILNLKPGDSFTVTSAENSPIELKVGNIIEMYAGHFIFANDATYQQAFEKEAVPNAKALILKDDSEKTVKSLAIELMKLDAVETVMQNASLITQVNNMASSLNSVMQMIIVLSVLLAVVILYNITNINVNERMRELSTTKVLGYYDKEVTLYIYRETILLSLFGILVGYLFGRMIHVFMMITVAPLNLMFDPSVVISAFTSPALLIILVSAALGLIIHGRLKKVDMLEALKSVE